MSYIPRVNEADVLLEKIVVLKRAHKDPHIFESQVAKWFVDLRLTVGEKQALYTAINKSTHAYQLFSLGSMLDLWHLCDMDKKLDLPPHATLVAQQVQSTTSIRVP